MEAHQTRVWTAIPGIVQAFRPGGPSGQVVDVQPSIKGKFKSPDGSTNSVNMPMLLDCPVQWQGGGGCTLTFPIKPGDECLVVFSSRCIDAWWQNGGVQEQAEFRMHDLSDGFALVGVRSVPRAFTVSTSAAQLRTDDGSAYVEINPESRKIKALTSGDIEAKASGNIVLDATNITLKGNIVLDGPITQANTTGGGTTATMIGPLNVVNDVVAGGKSLINHVHSGVQSGGSNTDKPV